MSKMTNYKSRVYAPFTMTREQLVSEYDSGRTKFWNYNFQELDLSRLDIESVTFFNCNFAYANLHNARLRNCDLSYSDFTGANFYGADLSFTFLIVSCLNNADLRKASLEKANVMRAYFQNAKLQDANITGCNIKQYQLNESWEQQQSAGATGATGADESKIDWTKLEQAEHAPVCSELGSTYLISRPFAMLLKEKIEKQTRGEFQRGLVQGWNMWSLSDLSGKAKKFQGKYSNSRDALVTRIDRELWKYSMAARLDLRLCGEQNKRRYRLRLIISVYEYDSKNGENGGFVEVAKWDWNDILSFIQGSDTPETQNGLPVLPSLSADDTKPADSPDV